MADLTLSETMTLDKIFTKEDIRALVYAATGKVRGFEDIEIELETFDLKAIAKAPDYVRLPFYADHGTTKSRLVARTKDGFSIAVTNDGDISYRNEGDVRFKLCDPLICYQLVLQRMRPELFRLPMCSICQEEIEDTGGVSVSAKVDLGNEELDVVVRPLCSGCAAALQGPPVTMSTRKKKG
jgi:hypothetical protein